MPKLSKYFDIRELVSPIVYNRWKENAWMFFNPEVIAELDLIREKIGVPITINDWMYGGQLTQCGLRSNLDQIVKDATKKNQLYISAHMLACGFDLHCSKNKELWEMIHQMIETKELKHFRRLEGRTQTKDAWVHVDCYNNGSIVF